MSGSARTGVLIYAKQLDKVSSFYEQVLGAKVLHADSEHRVLQSPDVQLIRSLLPYHPCRARNRQSNRSSLLRAWSQQSVLPKNTVARCGGHCGLGPVYGRAISVIRKVISFICVSVQANYLFKLILLSAGIRL